MLTPCRGKLSWTSAPGAGSPAWSPAGSAPPSSRSTTTRSRGWGVLHHTGAMWRAIDNAASIVPVHSMFHIMIYQTRRFSGAWLVIKKFYNRCPRPLRVVLLYIFAAYDVTRTLLRGQSPIKRARNYPVKSRGMSWFRDLEDWLGGLPYEHATSEEITNFMAERGFELRRRHNAEFVFSRVRCPSAPAC